MLNDETMDFSIESLFSEISEDLAETINGGVGNCHRNLIV